MKSKMCIYPNTIIVLLFLIETNVIAQPLFENSDFAQGTSKNWTVEGKAFQRGPTTGAVVPQSDVTGSVKGGLSRNWKSSKDMYRQPNLEGYAGKAFANSYHPERLDKTTGALTSKPFVIQNDYISFQLAGGQQQRPGVLAVNLLVGGKIVRQAIPKYGNLNRRQPILKNVKFTQCCFDVRSLKGKESQIRIYDDQVLYGGWIAAGMFVGEDKPGSDWIVDDSSEIIRKVSVQRRFKSDKRYLNIPAKAAFPGDGVKLVVDGRVVQEICMAVCDEKDADFWQFFDLSLWQAKEVTLTMDGWSSSAEPLAGVAMDDKIRGLDNLYDEKYRPQFHYTPIQGWNNDVNGTVYYDGEYHLFFQYDPSQSGNIGRNMHWGHAVSRDLFHWEHLPIALGVDLVRGQNYSGSAVVDVNNVAGLQKGKEKTLIAFYTRRKPHMFLLHDYDVGRSDQCMAYSNDRGRTWTHVEKPAVEGISFKNRDPKVFWHQQSGKWIMVFFIRDGYSFYSSDNLKDWKRESHVSGYHECPDIFRLNIDSNEKKTKWVLVGGRGHYTIGHFDGKQFVEEAKASAIHGPISATQTFNNTPDDGERRIQMSWFHMGSPGMPFRQMITLPVELTLRTTDEGVRMFTNPVKEIASHRVEHRSYPEKDLSAGPLKITDLPWELTDMELVLELKGAQKVHMSIWGQKMSYDAKSQTFQLDRMRAKVPPQDSKIKLRILVDRCAIDLFANDGRACIMQGMHPDRSKPAFECSAEGGAAVVKDIKFHRLRSMWKKK